MKIDVTTRALIPSGLVAEAARESSRRALGRMQAHARDIRVTVTDRRLKPGVVCCQVEIDLAEGTAAIARSVSANPVEAVSQAFYRAARSVFRRLVRERTRLRTAQYRQVYAPRSRAAQTDTNFHQGGSR